MPVPADNIDHLRDMVAAPPEDISDTLLAQCLAEASYLDEDGETLLYDYWGAGHRACILLAARYKGQFTFSVGQQKLNLAEKLSNCLAMAAQFASLARLQSLTIDREDLCF